ncbi:sugar phosphate isomerase/epimerase family protein [Nocardia jiangxiensis]|uniref:sugar phosphate isomerase/epimerase family protein n=1 Tax=Nocardia jiangxiensis TaxID=282685 RepID=UPI0002E9426C|nr:TIM barrel protein [Nocardia jiangxiensis]
MPQTHSTNPATTADRLGIEFQTVFGLPPVEFVHLAADLGCRYIGLALTGTPDNPHHYPPYSLREDPALRHRTRTALTRNDISVSLGEGFVIRAGRDIRDSATDLDIFAELGCTRLATTSMDTDHQRTVDQIGQLTDMAATRDMRVVVEFAPSLTIPDLPAALSIITAVARPDCRLLIDTLHFIRAGHHPADLAALDPTLIAYLQLSDHTLHQQAATYREDTLNRLPPSDGELPLSAILDTTPTDTVIGLEIPMLTRARNGETIHDTTRYCLTAARTLLEHGALRQPGDPGARCDRRSSAQDSRTGKD